MNILCWYVIYTIYTYLQLLLSVYKFTTSTLSVRAFYYFETITCKFLSVDKHFILFCSISVELVRGKACAGWGFHRFRISYNYFITDSFVFCTEYVLLKRNTTKVYYPHTGINRILEFWNRACVCGNMNNSGTELQQHAPHVHYQHR